MNRLLFSLAFCSLSQSLAIVPQSVEDSLSEMITTSCSYEVDANNAVTAWPGGACAADAEIITSLSASTPYPLSCPPNPQNTKCFPIWEESSSTPEHGDEIFSPTLSASQNQQQNQLELRSTPRTGNTNTKRSNDTPVSAVEPPTGYKARSINLKWPDAMQHAVFYIDAGCQEFEGGATTQAEGTWHVERVGTTREQCHTLPEQGRWASVEFMRGNEWRVWERRRRGEDDGVGGWGWKGLL